MKSVVAVLAVGAALLTVSCGSGQTATSQSTPTGSVGQPPNVAEVLSSSEDLNNEMAKHVSQVLGTVGAQDFQVGVTPVVDPIGTLYRKGRSVPIDDRSCVPMMEPMARDMPNAFPNYRLQGALASQLGLDDAVFKGVAEVSAGVGKGSDFVFSVLRPKLKALTDSDIEAQLMDPKCAKVLKAGLQIVRGYVSGQRNFVTKTDLNANAKVGVSKVGKFDVTVSSAGTVTIADPEPEGFLQILSEVQILAGPAVGGAPLPAKASLTEPKPASGVGQIYVQQDRSDDPAKGTAVLDLLVGAGFNVDRRVERTSSTHTPNQAQVRYFNPSDEDSAKKVLEKFQIKYPSATLAPMKMPAPTGQVEVWLPRTPRTQG